MSTTTVDQATSVEKPAGGRPEDERYPLGKTFLYGLQHIMTMYGGVIAPPIIVGQAAGLDGAQIGVLVSAALLVSGLATALQTLGIRFFGSQLPLVQGISFATVSTMVAVASGDGGLPAVFGAIIVAAAIGLAITPFFAQVVRFFPPVVTGTIITIIGVSLLPTAAGWMMGGDEEAADWGLIWRAVDDAELMAEATALAEALAKGPTRGYALTKKAIQAASTNSLDQQLELEGQLQREAGLTEDYKEGVSAFLQKRQPRFSGR